MNRRILLAAAALTAFASPADAHATLVRASPPVGGEHRGPVELLQLRFSERIEPSLSRVRIETPAGATIEAHVMAASDPHAIIAHAPPLTPGAYRVRWRAVSVDTHVTEGDYTFRVTP